MQLGNQELELIVTTWSGWGIMKSVKPSNARCTASQTFTCQRKISSAKLPTTVWVASPLSLNKKEFFWFPSPLYKLVTLWSPVFVWRLWVWFQNSLLRWGLCAVNTCNDSTISTNMQQIIGGKDSNRWLCHRRCPTDRTCPLYYTCPTPGRTAYTPELGTCTVHVPGPVNHCPLHANVRVLYTDRAPWFLEQNKNQLCTCFSLVSPAFRFFFSFQLLSGWTKYTCWTPKSTARENREIFLAFMLLCKYFGFFFSWHWHSPIFDFS